MFVVRSVRSRRSVSRRRSTTEKATVMLMRDRAMSTAAGDDDYASERITIVAVMMSGSTMVMAVEDNMMEIGGQHAGSWCSTPWPSAWPVKSPAR